MCLSLRGCVCRYMRVCVCVGRESLLECFDVKIVYARKICLTFELADCVADDNIAGELASPAG